MSNKILSSPSATQYLAQVCMNKKALSEAALHLLYPTGFVGFDEQNETYSEIRCDKSRRERILMPSELKETQCGCCGKKEDAEVTHFFWCCNDKFNSKYGQNRIVCKSCYHKFSTDLLLKIVPEKVGDSREDLCGVCSLCKTGENVCHVFFGEIHYKFCVICFDRMYVIHRNLCSPEKAEGDDF